MDIELGYSSVFFHLKAFQCQNKTKNKESRFFDAPFSYLQNTVHEKSTKDNGAAADVDIVTCTHTTSTGRVGSDERLNKLQKKLKKNIWDMQSSLLSLLVHVFVEKIIQMEEKE